MNKTNVSSNNFDFEKVAQKITDKSIDIIIGNKIINLGLCRGIGQTSSNARDSGIAVRGRGQNGENY
jgi:hypothetical protein